MSPLERWSKLTTPDRIFLPLEPDELEIVCCDVVERTIAHDGIQWANAKFQSPALQKLRRSLPQALRGKVMVHHSGHLARIWVRDPVDGGFLEVLNNDPDTKDLTVKQARELDLIRGPHDSERRRSAAEGRRHIRDVVRQIVEAKSPKAKRMLMKLLSLETVESRDREASQPTEPAKARGAKKKPKPPESATSATSDAPPVVDVAHQPAPWIDDDAPLFETKQAASRTPKHGDTA